MIRLLVADDHAIVRRGLCDIIAEESDMQVVVEAECGQDVLDHLEQHTIDVIILDINMPGKSGLQILKDIKYMSPRTAILILTMYPENQYAIRVFREGASGYLTKDSAPEEMVAAIRTIYKGGKYITPSLAQELASHMQADAGRPRHELLSSREFEVLQLMAKSKNLTQVAEKLHLSVKTVSTYRIRILEKLELQSNAELIRYALEHHLID